MIWSSAGDGEYKFVHIFLHLLSFTWCHCRGKLYEIQTLRNPSSFFLAFFFFGHFHWTITVLILEGKRGIF